MLNNDFKNLVLNSGLFDGQWYYQRYQDVQISGLTPIEHFINFGLGWNRDPSSRFSCDTYLNLNPDVKASNVPAFQHYLTAGIHEQRRLRHLYQYEQKPVSALRNLLETGGNTETALNALIKIGQSQENPIASKQANEALGFWFLQQNRFETAIKHFMASGDIDNTIASPHLVAVTALAKFAVGKIEDGNKILENCDQNLDRLCARLNSSRQSKEALATLNEIFQFGNHEPILINTGQISLFDSLVAIKSSYPQDKAQPLISIIMAAHNAADTIGTAINSILNQKHSNFELIIIDDQSHDDTYNLCLEFESQDNRIRVIQSSQNIGAYACRNLGLDIATGEFVALMDADDWAHPERLSFQVTCLLENPTLIGNMIGHIRVDNNLHITRWTGTGQLAHEAVASFMFRRNIVRKLFGYWDQTRVSADAELIRRIRMYFGIGSIASFPKHILLLQRDNAQTATRDPHLGMTTFYYGARREYHAAQLVFHNSKRDLYYSNSQNRPFPVPEILVSSQTKAAHIVDCLIVGCLSFLDEGRIKLVREIELNPHKKWGLIHLDTGKPFTGYIHNKFRQVISKNFTQVFCYGERVIAKELFLLEKDVDLRRYRYLPDIIKFSINCENKHLYTE